MASGQPAGLVEDEDVRAARLLEAQDKAAELFAAIEPRGIIVPGVREVEASNGVHLVDRERQIGGFFEELLDLGLDPA